MNLVKMPLLIGRVLMMNKLTAVMKVLNIGWFRLVSGLFPSRPGTVPILELKSPIARREKPWDLRVIASLERRVNRSSFH